MFSGLHIILFGDLMQLAPVRGRPSQVFVQPERMQPATHLWREFPFCELTQNMCQRSDQPFINLLNNLRFGNVTKDDLNVLLSKLDNDTGPFALGEALGIHPTVKQVDDHNRSVLVHFTNRNVQVSIIQAQDRIVDSAKSTANVDITTLIPTDINKTGGLPKTLTLFVGAKIMLHYNVATERGLVNGAMGNVTALHWPLYRRAQIYSQDIPSVTIYFKCIGTQQIDPMSVQFPSRFGYGTAEQRMLLLILCCRLLFIKCNVHQKIVLSSIWDQSCLH